VGQYHGLTCRIRAPLTVATLAQVESLAPTLRVAFVIAANARSTSVISATAQPGPYDLRVGGMSRLVQVAGAQRCIREAMQIDVIPFGVALEVRDQADHSGIRTFTELRESSFRIGEIFDSEPPREGLTHDLVGVYLYADGH